MLKSSNTKQPKHNQTSRSKLNQKRTTIQTSIHNIPKTITSTAPSFSTTSTPTPTPIAKKKKKKSQTLTASTDVKNHTAINTSPHGVLVRDFIRESLYSKQGYFNASRVINSPGVINFSQLLGKDAYEKRLDDLYFSGIQGWTTPVEIFQPFYAQSLARFFISHVIPTVNQRSLIRTKKLDDIFEFQKAPTEKRKRLQTLKKQVQIVDGTTVEQDMYARNYGASLQQPDLSTPINDMNLSIIEIGGGNGTCATNIMDFLHVFYPNIYKSTNYTIFEMSETLSLQQRELLDAVHSGKYKVYTKNAAEIDFSTLSPNFKQLHNLPTSQTSTTPPMDPSTQRAFPHQRLPPSVLAQQQQLQQQQLQQQRPPPADLSSAIKSNQSKTLNIETKSVPKDHAFIFGLEVLDNMVHDKIIKGTDGNWYQVMVAEKQILDKIAQDAVSDPEKVYNFPLYEHPAEQLELSRQKLREEENNDVQIQDNTGEGKLQDNEATAVDEKLTPSKTKRKVKQISAQQLHVYMTKKTLPVNYSLLNLLPTSKYLEYVMPIYDPIIQECTDHYKTYVQADSPYFDSSNLPVSHIQNQSQPHHQHGGILGWFTKRILSRNLSVHEDITYLPTELLRFMHRVNILYPSHTLLLADFDALPTTEAIPGRNGPVVAHKATESQLRGKTKDEESYLVELGLCDIFFPTDFNFMKHLYTQVCLGGKVPGKQLLSPLARIPIVEDNNNGVVQNPTPTATQNKQKLAQLNSTSLTDEGMRTVLSNPTPIENASIAVTQEIFLNTFAEIEKTECKNGFNPMLSDYNNMALFIGQRK
jgi:hypothetical protein